MSQAAIWGVPGTGPSTPANQADRDNDSLDALLSGHIGASRPTYAVQGTTWVKDTGSSPLELEVYFFDGTDDILLGTIDVAANTYTPVLPANVLEKDTAATVTKGYTVTSPDLGNLNSATTLHISDGHKQYATMTGSFTLTAPDDAAEGYLDLELTIDATGGYTLTLSGFDELSGTVDTTLNVVNKLRIDKSKSATTIEIVQVP